MKFFIDYLALLGVSYFLGSKYKKAISPLEEAIKYGYKENYFIWYSLWQVYKMNNSIKNEKIINAREKLNELNVKDANILLDLSKEYLYDGNITKTINTLKNIFEFEPNNIDAHRAIGWCNLVLNKE